MNKLLNDIMENHTQYNNFVFLVENALKNMKKFNYFSKNKKNVLTNICTNFEKITNILLVLNNSFVPIEIINLYQNNEKIKQIFYAIDHFFSLKFDEHVMKKINLLIENKISTHDIYRQNIKYYIYFEKSDDPDITELYNKTLEYAVRFKYEYLYLICNNKIFEFHKIGDHIIEKFNNNMIQDKTNNLIGLFCNNYLILFICLFILCFCMK